MRQLLFFTTLLFCVIFQSCETYGPATRCQNTRYMERPFREDEDTSATYVSARLIKGAYYRPNDNNISGDLSIHHSWVTEHFYCSVGGFGQLGRYNVKDSVTLGYNGLGLMLDFGLRTRLDRTEISFLTFSISRNFEGGDYHKYRVKQALERDSGTLREMRQATTDIFGYFGIKHQMKNNKTVSGRMGIGFSANDEAVAYGQFDISYQLTKNIFCTANAVLPIRNNSRKGNTRLDVVQYWNLVSLGVSYGF